MGRVAGWLMGGTGDDHDDRHRSNDSGQSAGSAAQPEAGKLPDRGGLGGSRLRLEPPGGPVRPADDAAVAGIPGAVENRGNGVRWGKRFSGYAIALIFWDFEASFQVLAFGMK